MMKLIANIAPEYVASRIAWYKANPGTELHQLLRRITQIIRGEIAAGIEYTQKKREHERLAAQVAEQRAKVEAEYEKLANLERLLGD
jgi:hypothetical protein